MKKTILFVDDEEINLLVLKKIFGENYDVLTANCGQAAADVIINQAGGLNAVISDFKMPDMSGLELFERMNDSLIDVPCFLLTGYDQTEEIKDALNKKVIKKLFKKPFDTDEINRTLEQYV